MNKQQLASTIWQSANQMRSKIEANEYKDYILGFMFYKYLSDREISFLKGEKYSDEDIKKVTADDEKLVKHISENIGYFIAYEDLFSSWLSKGDDFDVSDVRDALSNFDANIEPTYKKLFENIFKTLQSGLSKLGETSTKQTKSIKALLKLIKRIPMDGKQDYDVLGFIYEYLISMFAANAGKKAGEFYTPHEVSVLMSEIVANHLKDREHIKIYDPTSGSGSLLINIGASMAQYIEGENKIDYYAQMAQILDQVRNLQSPMALNEFINGRSISITRDNPNDPIHLGKEISLKIYDRQEIALGQSRWGNEGWAVPVVEESYNPDRTRLTLEFAKKQAGKPNDKKQTTKTEIHREKIRNFLTENELASARAISMVIGLSAERTRVILAKMEDAESVGGNRNRKYKLRTEKQFDKEPPWTEKKKP